MSSVKFLCSGCYRHELSKFWDAYWKKDAQDKLGWRLDYNQKFRGDVYATHGLGPIAQVLNIHRGDKDEYACCNGYKVG